MKIERRNPGAFQFVEEEFGSEVGEPFSRADLLEHIRDAITTLRPDRNEQAQIVAILVAPGRAARWREGA
jgi:hypothetical protein